MFRLSAEGLLVTVSLVDSMPTQVRAIMSRGGKDGGNARWNERAVKSPPTQPRLVIKLLLRVASVAAEIGYRELKKIGVRVESRLDPGMFRAMGMSCVLRGLQLSWTTCRTTLGSKKKKRSRSSKNGIGKIKLTRRGAAANVTRNFLCGFPLFSLAFALASL